LLERLPKRDIWAFCFRLLLKNFITPCFTDGYDAWEGILRMSIFEFFNIFS